MGKGNKILIDFIVELIKVLSCVDAVFKLLHVEIARKATDGERKKNEERKKNLVFVLQCVKLKKTRIK